MKEVDAVKTAAQREQIEFHLTTAGQIYADIWKLGVNTALRISDLLSITMDDIRNMDRASPALAMIEQKTGKRRKIALNVNAVSVVYQRLARVPDDHFLFQSKTHRATPAGNGKPVDRSTVVRVFAQAGKQVKPRVQLGTHSMRKTRGYVMHEKGIAIEQIARMLNHSTPAETMRYIGLTQKMVDLDYMEMVL